MYMPPLEKAEWIYMDSMLMPRGARTKGRGREYLSSAVRKNIYDLNQNLDDNLNLYLTPQKPENFYYPSEIVFCSL